MNNTASDKKQGRRVIVAAGSSTPNMLILSVLLERFHYKVATAADGARAFEQISALHPALVISDLVLPDMRGIDLFHRLQENKSTASLPVIFMVPASDAAAESQCLAYGAAGCIMKPVQAEELYRTVQAVTEPKPRANIRIDASLPVSINNEPVGCPGGNCLIDLSEEGMHLPVNKPYPVKGRIAVQLRIKDRMISAEGSVLYSHASASGRHSEPGIGLKFTSIAPQDQDFIRKFIREEVTRDINKAASGLH